jgi:WD40 repeat protein/predicted Ser/Thr protein kinase
MAEGRLARVRELFDQAADLPAADRSAFLEAACAGDGALRAEIEALLARDSGLPVEGAEADFLKSPVVRPPSLAPGQPSATPPLAAPLPPTVGRYRVVRLLGEGGMGTVYEAEQDNPRRIVALKVLRAGLDSELLRRFAREAQILGRLQHPGIAQVYDAGVAEGGQLYFAMELIAGVPLDRYVREQALDTRGRLELFARVCDAVQHAHERGVIHRDLKPANILVEASGQPRVLDFGVARAAQTGLTAGGGRTEAGQLIGTLNYMSPEQASGDPAAIDPRGDVYALGVLLYELLAHRLPYSLEGLPLPEAVQVIREQEPSRLGSLDGRLRGDLETIAAKALEKDRGRRYVSAGELAADVRRHLNHEPIRARPASALYQLRKFARRHKALVGAMLGIGLALAAGTLVSVLYAVRADHNARQARHQTYLARLAAASAALSHHDVADAARQLEAAPEELRGWEWRHLHARLDDSAAVLRAGHLLRRGRSGYRVATFTPDALVVKDEEGGLISTTPLQVVPRGEHDVHAGDDTTWLVAEVVDGPGGVIRLLESTGRQRPFRLPPGHHGAENVAFSPDGKRLAITQTDHSISVCDVSAGCQTAHLPPYGRDFNAIAFSEDGRRLAVAADLPAVSVWDTDTGRVVVELRTHMTRVMTVAFHPRGDRLLTASPDGSVHQWDLGTRREVDMPYERHEGVVKAVAYSPDGLRVASAGQDRTIRLWRAKGRQEEAVLHGHTRTVVSLAFSRDGRRLASYQDDGVVRLWDTGPDATLPVLRGHTSYVYPVAYTPDGRRIASGAWDGDVRLWDAVTGQLVAVLPQGGFVRDLALSPDGTRLVAMGDGTDGLRVWNVAAGARIATYKTADNMLWAVAFRPGGAHVAVLGSGHVIEILDAATGERVTTADAGRLEYADRRALAYSPDGRLLAGPYEGNQVGLWEADTYRLVGTFTGHKRTVLSVAFSANGRRLVSGGADSLIKVWDVESKDCLLTLSGHADEVFAAVFHPYESRIASGGRDRLVRLWDAATGEELVRLPGHSDYVFSLAFSPDGKTLVSSSGDTTLRVWDTEPLRERYQARREAAALRPEAERLVAKLWRPGIDPGKVVETLRADRALREPLRHAALRDVLRRARPLEGAPDDPP